MANVLADSADDPQANDMFDGNGDKSAFSIEIYTQENTARRIQLATLDGTALRDPVAKTVEITFDLDTHVPVVIALKGVDVRQAVLNDKPIPQYDTHFEVGIFKVRLVGTYR